MDILGRWARGSLQALALLVPCFALHACAPTTHGHAAPVPPRLPPDAIVIRTDRFTFHMGARVDPTWPAKAEETRDALGGELEALMVDEDTTVSVLARQLGVTWPEEPLDFDVTLEPGADSLHAACASEPGRLVRVTDRRVVKPRPTVFFACILDRALAELADRSTLHHALVDARPADAERLYACVRRFAVWTLVIARQTDDAEALVVERGLAETCTPRELEWLKHAWIKRVREEDSPADFALRVVKEEGERHEVAKAPKE